MLSAQVAVDLGLIILYSELKVAAVRHSYGYKVGLMEGETGRGHWSGQSGKAARGWRCEGHLP